MQHKQLSRIMIALLTVAILLSACGGNGGNPTPATTSGSVEPTAEMTATPANGQAILVAPEGSAAEILAQLTELAGQNAWSVAQKNEVQPSDLAGVKIVVFLSAPANLSDLLAAAVDTQFVVVSASALESKPNLTVINTDVKTQTFVAGYIASIIAPDWRSAGLLGDSPAGLDDIFTRGVQYYCGRCAPFYAPVINFPVTAVKPNSTTVADWKAAFDTLDENVIETLYVSPGAVSQEMIDYLILNEMILVSAGPLPDSAKEYWAASVEPDVPAVLKTIWGDISSGQGGKSITAPITVKNINDALLSEGRLRLVQKVVDDLNSGALSPGN